MIDNGFSSENLSYVLRIGGIMLIMAVIGLICGLLSGRFAAVASAGLGKKLEKKIFFTGFRIFRSRILTSFPRRVW